MRDLNIESSRVARLIETFSKSKKEKLDRPGPSCKNAQGGSAKDEGQQLPMGVLRRMSMARNTSIHMASCDIRHLVLSAAFGWVE